MPAPVEITRHSFSMLNMFLQSDLFMKALIIALFLASVCFKKIREKTKLFETKFWSGASMESLYQEIGNRPQDPLSAIFTAAMKEWRRSLKQPAASLNGASIKERLEKVMQITIDKEVDQLERRMTFLASVGSVAPLLGLFGTVWGIMDSFNSIGLSQSTNISAVAPGVAEALFTTAVGLIAAIPAVLAYNKLSTDIDGFTKQMENFASELSTLLSRQLDQSASSPKEQA